MSVWKISHEEYLKVREDDTYSFLADTEKRDHGEFMTWTVSDRAMPMLIERCGLKTVSMHHKVHHFIPETETP
jgi:hypothetical protein